jgi:LysR family glycine cleavage system transcriptional activator
MSARDREPPHRRLPFLNALRAFEATARLGGLARAADALCVTPAAVSHQIRSLEDSLGVALFMRTRQGLQLTREAEHYLEGVQAGFARLEEATSRLRSSASSRTLRVNAPAGFASRWLSPRLPSFISRYADVEIRLTTNKIGIEDVRRGTVDVAVRYEADPLPDLSTFPFLADEVFPVCSPALAKRAADGWKALLSSTTLLHVECGLVGATAHPNWQQWLRRADLPEVRNDRGPVFDHGDLAIDAALAGQGVMLGKRALIEQELRSGKLVCPLPLAFKFGFQHRLSHSLAKAEDPAVRAFSNWLLHEVGKAPGGPALADMNSAPEADAREQHLA